MQDDNGEGAKKKEKKRGGDYLAWKERLAGLVVDRWWSCGRRRRRQLLDEREGEGEAHGGGAATAMKEEGETVSGEGEVWWC
jgi:hypothetical protein